MGNDIKKQMIIVMAENTSFLFFMSIRHSKNNVNTITAQNKYVLKYSIIIMSFAIVIFKTKSKIQINIIHINIRFNNFMFILLHKII